MRSNSDQGSCFHAYYLNHLELTLHCFKRSTYLAYALLLVQFYWHVCLITPAQVNGISSRSSSTSSTNSYSSSLFAASLLAGHNSYNSTAVLIGLCVNGSILSLLILDICCFSISNSFSNSNNSSSTVTYTQQSQQKQQPFNLNKNLSSGNNNSRRNSSNQRIVPSWLSVPIQQLLSILSQTYNFVCTIPFIYHAMFEINSDAPSIILMLSTILFSLFFAIHDQDFGFDKLDSLDRRNPAIWDFLLIAFEASQCATLSNVVKTEASFALGILSGLARIWYIQLHSPYSKRSVSLLHSFCWIYFTCISGSLLFQETFSNLQAYPFVYLILLPIAMKLALQMTERSSKLDREFNKITRITSIEDYSYRLDATLRRLAWTCDSLEYEDYLKESTSIIVEDISAVHLATCMNYPNCFCANQQSQAMQQLQEQKLNLIAGNNRMRFLTEFITQNLRRICDSNKRRAAAAVAATSNSSNASTSIVMTTLVSKDFEALPYFTQIAFLIDVKHAKIQALSDIFAFLRSSNRISPLTLFFMKQLERKVQALFAEQMNLSSTGSSQNSYSSAAQLASTGGTSRRNPAGMSGLYANSTSGKNNGLNGSNSVVVYENLLIGIEFDSLLNDVEAKFTEGMEMKLNFLTQLSGDFVNLVKFQNVADAYSFTRRAIFEDLQQLCTLNMNSQKLKFYIDSYLILMSFADKKKDILNGSLVSANSSRAKRMRHGNRNAVAAAAALACADVFDKNTCVVFISLINQVGKILRVQNRFENLFGYSLKACVGHNIDKIMPTIIANRHTQILTDFVNRESIGSIRNSSTSSSNANASASIDNRHSTSNNGILPFVFAKTHAGWGVPVRVRYQLDCFEMREYGLSAQLRVLPLESAILMTNNEFKIQLITEQLFTRILHNFFSQTDLHRVYLSRVIPLLPMLAKKLQRNISNPREQSLDGFNKSSAAAASKTPQNNNNNNPTNVNNMNLNSNNIAAVTFLSDEYNDDDDSWYHALGVLPKVEGLAKTKVQSFYRRPERKYFTRTDNEKYLMQCFEFFLVKIKAVKVKNDYFTFRLFQILSFKRLHDPKDISDALFFHAEEMRKLEQENLLYSQTEAQSDTKLTLTERKSIATLASEGFQSNYFDDDPQQLTSTQKQQSMKQQQQQQLKENKQQQSKSLFQAESSTNGQQQQYNQLVSLRSRAKQGKSLLDSTSILLPATGTIGGGSDFPSQPATDRFPPPRGAAAAAGFGSNQIERVMLQNQEENFTSNVDKKFNLNNINAGDPYTLRFLETNHNLQSNANNNNNNNSNLNVNISAMQDDYSQNLLSIHNMNNTYNNNINNVSNNDISRINEDTSRFFNRNDDLNNQSMVNVIQPYIYNDLEQQSNQQLQQSQNVLNSYRADMHTRRSLLGGAGNGELQSNQMTASKLMKQLTDRVIDVDEFTILRPEGMGVQKTSNAKIAGSQPINVTGSGLNALASHEGNPNHKNNTIVADGAVQVRGGNTNGNVIVNNAQSHGVENGNGGEIEVGGATYDIDSMEEDNEDHRRSVRIDTSSMQTSRTKNIESIRATKQSIYREKTSAFFIGMTVFGSIALLTILVLTLVLFLSISSELTFTQQCFSLVPWGMNVRSEMAYSIKADGLLHLSETNIFSSISGAEYSKVQLQRSKDAVAKLVGLYLDFLRADFTQYTFFLLAESDDHMIDLQQSKDELTLPDATIADKANKYIHKSKPAEVILIVQALQIQQLLADDASKGSTSLMHQMLFIDNMPTLNTQLVAVQDAVKALTIEVLDSIYDFASLLRTLVIVVSLSFISSVFPIYYFAQKRKEEVFYLFATLSQIHLKSLIQPIGYFLADIHTSKANPYASAAEDRLTKKRKAITEMSSLKKFEPKYLLFSVISFCLIVIQPIVCEVLVSNFSTSSKDNLNLLINFFDLKAQSTSNLFINYQYIMHWMVPSYVMYSPAYYTNRFKTLYTQNSDKLKTMYSIINEAHSKTKFNQAYYDDFLFKIFESNVCTALDNYPEFVNSDNSIDIQECQELRSGTFSKGLQMNMKALFQLFSDLKQIYDVNDATLIQPLLIEWESQNNLRDYETYSTMLLKIIDICKDFMISMMDDQINEMVVIEQVLVVYQVILLFSIFYFGWIQFYLNLQRELISTRKLISIVSIEVILENPYFKSYLQN